MQPWGRRCLTDKVSRSVKGSGMRHLALDLELSPSVPAGHESEACPSRVRFLPLLIRLEACEPSMAWRDGQRGECPRCMWALGGALEYSPIMG